MSNVIKPIVLVGPMGCGKSTVGLALAKALAYSFDDLDKSIESNLSMSISDMFFIYGESYFRDKETFFLNESLKKSHTIIATGGGIIGREINCKAIKDNSTCIYLYASVQTQYQRTLNDSKRPLLNTQDRYEKLSSLFKVRHSLYKSVCNCCVDTDDKDIDSIVSMCLECCIKNASH